MPETPATHHPFAIARAGHLIGGRYRLTYLIASGGMAEVWEATDQILERPVAVKILHPHLAADQSFTLRFRGEAIAAARLHHPSIVGIYDTCNDGGLEAIVMELVRGRTLRAYLDERGRLDPVEVVQIGADVADALEAAHHAGIVHRDIKPANILLCDDARVLVTDFGIAKVRDDTDMTSTGTMLGSVKYLAPEQVEGRPVDARTDLYALGVVLYEALCGQPPFVADTAAATALARLHHDPPAPQSLRPDLPPGLDSLLRRALAREPDGRFSSAADLRTALLGLRLTEGSSADEAELWYQGGDATVIDASPPALAASGWPTSPTPNGTTHLDADPWGREPSGIASSARPAAGSPRPALSPPRSRSRRGLVVPLVLVVLIGSALGVAALLVGRTEPGRQLLDQVDLPDPAGTATGSVPVRSIAPFDPNGSGTPGENNLEAVLAVDGKATTGWHTEGYSTRRFGNLKPGLGLDVTLDRTVGIDRVEITSPTRGWSASIYVADQAGATLAAWGAPVVSLSGIEGSATFELHGATGRHVLVWITDLGDGPSLVTAELDEITIRA